MVAMLATSISFVSCDKDDDDDDKKKSQFTYENTEYDLDEGSLTYYGVWGTDSVDEGYNFDIFLFSSGISFESDSTGYIGVGNFIYFEMFSSSTTELVEGTYNFDADATYAPNTFDMGDFAINFNMDTFTGDLQESIAGGTVNIEKDGSDYKITVECTDSSDKTITGYFEGALTYEDQSNKKSSSAKKSYIRK